MSVIDLNHDSLGKLVGEEVPEMYVLIAKNSVMGLAGPQIADILGVEAGQIDEVEADPIYQKIRLIIAAKHNESKMDADLSWDKLEALALKGLMKRAEFETDVDVNLRIATMANRAVRRTALPTNNPLDASRAGEVVRLKLTTRMIERFTDQGTTEREISQTRQVSLRHGEASNITFEDLDKHLGVSARPRIPENLTFRTSEPDLDARKLDEFMTQSMGARKP